MEHINILPYKPQIVLSTNADTLLAKIDQTGLDIKFQGELSQFLDQKRDLDQNRKKAYLLIYKNYCMISIQSRLDACALFELNIQNNPINMLKSIQNMMHQTVRSHYPLASMTGALNRLTNVNNYKLNLYWIMF